MPYLVDQSIPNALIESSISLTTSAASFKELAQNLPGIAPSSDLRSITSKSHSLPDLGSPYVSGSFYTSLVSSRPSSGSSGSSFTMEVPENMSLLCEELLTDLASDDGSWY